MRRAISTCLAALSIGLFAANAVEAGPWRVDLPDTVKVTGDKVLLRDLSSGPVPAAAGALVLQAGIAPNTSIAISRQAILRKLVTAGLGRGVRFGGAERCHVVSAGRELNSSTLAAKIRQELQRLVPPAVAGAPASWFEFDYENLRLSAAGDWRVLIERDEPLAPGRNLVRTRIESHAHQEVFSVSVELHCFDEIARTVASVDRDTPLSEALFAWTWQDLATVDRGVAVGRGHLAGASAARSLAAGEILRQSDLSETPLIRAGDPVELLVTRGQVAVSVRAFARQKGCLNQTIPVRNELTGRLVNARVAGPGLVEWRK